jgi:hypothetical protein
MIQALPLRDIHLPDTLLWWPLAIGWWFVIAMLLGIITGFGVFYYLKKKNKTQYRAITDALDILKQLAKEENKSVLITHISQLLRRVCISLYGRKQVAGLTGERWLRFLDRKGKTTAFTKGVGRVLVVYPYQKTVDYSRQEILLLVQVWLQDQRNQHV